MFAQLITVATSGDYGIIDALLFQILLRTFSKDKQLTNNSKT